MSTLQTIALIMSCTTGFIGLIIYFYKFSNQLNKLNKIESIEEKVDCINEKLMQDQVATSVLSQRVSQLEEEVKELYLHKETKG